MSVNIEKAKTLTKKVSLINMLSSSDNMFISLNLQGTAGIGKSTIVLDAAKEIGGYGFSIDVTTIQESELSGFPFKTVDADGEDYVEYSPFYAFSAVRKLEKEIYLKAKNEGLLDGKIRLNENDDIVIKEGGEERIIKNSINKNLFTKNAYSFGNNLPEEYKFELLNSGTIKPVIILFDELNRASKATLAETMNILLYHRVQSYLLPWWVNIVVATNPGGSDAEDYVQKITGAQKSRLLTLNIVPDVSCWARYNLRKGANPRLIEVLMNQPSSVFDNHTQPQPDEAQTDGRSWSFVAKILDNIEKINKFKFITDNERESTESDTTILCVAKIGNVFHTVNAAMKNLDEIPHPGSILTGTETINHHELKRLKNLTSIKMFIFVENLLTFMAKNAEKMISGKASKHYLNQFAALFENLNDTNKSYFLKNLKTTMLESDPNMSLFNILVSSKRVNCEKWQMFFLEKITNIYKTINTL